MSAQAGILLEDLKARAKERPEGYYEAFLAAGKVDGDQLLIDVEEAKRLAEKFHPMGLGSYVAKIARPVAKVIDGVLGTDLENCEDCKERKDWLDKHFPL